MMGLGFANALIRYGVIAIVVGLLCWRLYTIVEAKGYARRDAEIVAATKAKNKEIAELNKRLGEADDEADKRVADAVKAALASATSTECKVLGEDARRALDAITD